MTNTILLDAIDSAPEGFYLLCTPKEPIIMVGFNYFAYYAYYNICYLNSKIIPNLILNNN